MFPKLALRACVIAHNATFSEHAHPGFSARAMLCRKNRCRQSASLRASVSSCWRIVSESAAPVLLAFPFVSAFSLAFFFA